MKLNAEIITRNSILGFLPMLIRSKLFKKRLIAKLERELYKAIVENSLEQPRNVKIKKYELIVAMLNSAMDNFQKDYISKKFMSIAVGWVRNGLTDSKSLQAAKNFEKKYGQEPPGFVVLSPTQKCNLRCTGCYAASTAQTPTSLPYEIVERVVSDSYNLFGNRFMTISGGEPFLYNDKGKTLFDIWEKFDDMVYLVYTNGTLITEKVAQRLSRTFNVLPAISVEGFEKETDERRGKGTFKRILESMQYLRSAGIPVGISVTATKNNADLLLSDSFYDFFFEKQGVSHMWMFHLMPIGRAKDVMDLMPTAEQRVRLFRKWEKILGERKRFIADFWNSGVVVNGCIAYGKHYFYINWDGNIMPCVFIPYYVDKIQDIYKKGGTLEDALFSDFFKRGRKWQKNYGFQNPKKPGNWLAPCSIRDHYKVFREEVLVKDARPEDKEAEEALYSKEYFNFMHSFDQELYRLTEPIWQKEFLEDEGHQG